VHVPARGLRLGKLPAMMTRKNAKISAMCKHISILLGTAASQTGMLVVLLVAVNETHRLPSAILCYNSLVLELGYARNS
jgi:hypothetical protein